MKYTDYDTNENNQVSRCLTCDNEDIDFDNEAYAFCHICGSPVINKCLNEDECGVNVPANARFCPYCGVKTLFFERGILSDWKDEQNEINDNSRNSFNLNTDDPIPF